MNFHPLADLFPLIDGQAFADLVADIAKHGVREPVWLYDGQILDGRNRWRAAQEAGVTCETREYTGDDPVGFVVSLNLHRRHLSESQRAMVAARLANLQPGSNQHSLASANLHDHPITQAEAAELLNISTRLAASAKKVTEHASPEIVAAVDRGDMAVSLAAMVVDLPAEDQAVVSASAPEEIRDVALQVVKAHVAHNSGNNEWYTPTEYIEAARTVMGSIDTDPASSHIANATVKANTFFTVDDDGLKQTWAGNVWMNPPYAQPLIARFSEALVRKYADGEITQACVLVNNATETGWFSAMAEASSAVCFTKGRVRFIDPEGKPSGAPLQGQAILYFGDNAEAFAEQFKRFGYVFVGAPVRLAA